MGVGSKFFLSYVIKRCIQLLPIALAVVTINFLLIQIGPGDIVTMVTGEYATPEYIAATRARLGLDKPVVVQYFLYVSSVMRGDFGYSFYFREPVLEIVLQKFPATLLLMVASLAISCTSGVLLGVFSSKKPRSLLDNSITVSSLVLYSLPAFWLGLMLMLLFSVHLRWFPAQGIQTVRVTLDGLEKALDIAWHMVLPVLVMSAWYFALITRLMRANMLDVLQQDYITTARAKGLNESRVIFKHALRNAISPIITIVGLSAGYLFGGNVLVEVVFGWPGIGKLVYDSIMIRDYPVLMCIFFFMSVAVVLLNLASDILQAFIDPRIRHK